MLSLFHRSPEPDIVELCEDYIEHKTANRNEPLAKGTQWQKRFKAGQFKRWLGTKNIKDVTAKDMENYRVYLNSYLKPSSAFNTIVETRAFLAYLTDERKMFKVNPADKLKMSYPRVYKPPAPELHELREKLFAVCEDDRDRAAVCLSLYGGLG